MRSVCAWCGIEIREASPGSDPGVVTHGICPTCADRFFRPRERTMRGFLNDLDAPTVLVDGHVRVLEANDAALAVMGKGREEAVGYLGGEVFECAHARQPGGCGGTVHCVGCTLRSTVEETFITGHSCDHRVAVVRRAGPRDDAARTDTRLTISTEKVGGLVLIRLDHAAPVARASH